jgi:hypothetical protein
MDQDEPESASIRAAALELPNGGVPRAFMPYAALLSPDGSPD